MRGRRLSSMAKNFFIRTFGCQMNEHDSERLAGMLVADGMQQTDDMQQADVVVLNTCCIRENADQKLYGTLGSLKTLVDAKPGVQIAVGGCLAQKDRELIQQKVGWVDVVFGTHNLTSAPELLRRAEREGQVMEILDAPTPESISNHLMAPDAVRELPYAAWVNIQMGCDNSCAFCIVPSVRGPEVSRPLHDIVAEVEGLAQRGVTEVTLLGQNVNSYGRDITRRRPLFADLLRALGAVDGIGRIRFTSPHPKDLRPETIEAMAAVPEVCEQLHLPLQSGSNRVLAAMRRGLHRRAVPGAAGRGARGHRRPRRDDRHHRGLSRRDGAGLRGHTGRCGRCGLRQRVHVHLLAPAGDAGRRHGRRVHRGRGDLGALRTFEGRGRPFVAGAPPGAGRADRRASGRRGEPPRRVNAVGADPTGEIGALRADVTGHERNTHRRSVGSVVITAGHPHHLSGRLLEVTARPRHRVRIPLAGA